MTTETRKDIIFVYDGQCPLCQMGANFYRVRESSANLTTLDARTEKHHPIMQEINNAKLNLDAGMVVKYQNKLYQGDKALHLMAQLGDDKGLYNKTNRLLFRSQAIATISYPLLRLARNSALRIKGIKKIHPTE